MEVNDVVTEPDGEGAVGGVVRDAWVVEVGEVGEVGEVVAVLMMLLTISTVLVTMTVSVTRSVVGGDVT